MIKATLSTLALAGALLAFNASEASAWVCRAGGVGGTIAVRHWNIIDAKLRALRACERRSPVPVCTILYCRP